MTIFNQIFGINIFLSLAKVFFLVADFLFIVFLVVVFRQVISMQTLVNDSGDSLLLKSFVIILLALSISLFLTALVIL